MPEEGLDPPDTRIMIPLRFRSTAGFEGLADTKGDTWAARGLAARVPTGAAASNEACK